ncbi:hypothetical protein DFJ63DRAFT_335072 [Scheffersomyces coipomensis]|uniref:uncharacterized protein n=1 Tax=Scheffersomyces coipomensis TaxID=1788519 RepID=UPI00315D2F52
MAIVPILTIPELAFDPTGATTVRKKSALLNYLFYLTNGSSIFLIIIYLVGVFGLKPLLNLKNERRLQLFDSYRIKLMEFYLKLITKVSYIPIVSKKLKKVNKDGVEEEIDGKLYNDMVIQTDDSYLEKSNASKKKSKVSFANDDQDDEGEDDDKLYQNKLINKLTKLNEKLNKVESYSILKLSNFKITAFSIKDFQNKADLIYFDYNNYFTNKDVVTNLLDKKGGGSTEKDVKDPTTFSGYKKHKNLAVETKTEIRNIKGLYMSGQY